MSVEKRGPRVDHIIIATQNAKAAADHFQKSFGLSAYQGGRHQGWGTENYLIPGDGWYIELIAVFDEDVAAKNSWGRGRTGNC
ncbi:hypothetical protein WJX73_005596 [Symbiochloris irregularis]|uniref:Glyoxalase-like domain-containing protein n=1 Tax=Symbiochloris irregularis TaxID=706552 RepID=A0AAW1PBW4_9CHLO